MTDTQTHKHTHRQTDKPNGLGEIHNTFFQRYNNNMYMQVHLSDLIILIIAQTVETAIITQIFTAEIE